MAELFFRGPLIGMAGVSDARRAAEAMAELRRRAEALEDPEIVGWLGEIEGDPLAEQLLAAIFSNSPFLTDCALAELPFLRTVLRLGPATAFSQVTAHLKDELGHLTDQDLLMRELRIARRRVALAVAIADITDHWPLERITQALSDFADVALSAAISHLLRQAAEKGDLVLKDPYFPEDDCGYVALAMGKHGARELNYSSDIDLIILYEPMKVDYRGSKSVQQAFVRMTKRLIAILDQRTADGYVFRVDMRLRPDPASTPVALPCAAARAYYGDRGENWERAAMIKARPAAGDLAMGRAFLAELTAFIWREHLDFWALREIQRIKQQIHAQRGGGEIGFFGHNIKLGRGGIREIEFFAQTQQLIFAGNDPYLRCQRTVEALTTLAKAGFIDERAADELTESYEFLRRLEHRLQMIADQQTQTLPTDDAGMTALAIFMGFDDLEEFKESLLLQLAQVEAHYADLFQEAAAPGEEAALDFTGSDLGEETAAVLGTFGYRDPPEAYRCIHRWLEGGCAAMQETRDRKLLGELLPAVVEKAAKTADPDRAIACLGGFWEALPPGTRCLSLLAANPALLDFLMEAVTTAPSFAAALGARPEHLEMTVTPGFYGVLHDNRLMLAEAGELLEQAPDLEAARRRAGKWARGQAFHVAAMVLRHGIDSADAGRAFSGIADAVCHHLLHRLMLDFGEGGGEDLGSLTLLAYGPFGSQELTQGSPLDLLFVYEKGHQGEAGIAALAGGFCEALAGQGAGGPLYDLGQGSGLWGRPGPLVASLDDLAALLAEDGSGARRLALMQARVVAGPAALARDLPQRLKALLVGSAAPQCLQPVGRAAPGPWDMRRRPGGLEDLEAAVRVLQLRFAADFPAVWGHSVDGALAAFADAGLMEDALVRDLLKARHLLRQVENVMTIALGPRLDGTDLPEALKANLARAAGLESFAQLEGAVSPAVELVQVTSRNLV